MEKNYSKFITINELQQELDNVSSKKDIDDLVGLRMAGTWSDEEIVQAIIERLGSARPYGDKANPNLASYDVNYEKREIIVAHCSGSGHGMNLTKIRILEDGSSVIIDDSCDRDSDTSKINYFTKVIHLTYNDEKNE